MIYTVDLGGTRASYFDWGSWHSNAYFASPEFTSVFLVSSTYKIANKATNDHLLTVF